MQLGGTPPQLVDQIKDGVVDIGWTLPGYTASGWYGLFAPAATPKPIISRLHAYHGVTLASASLTGIPAFHQWFDLPIDTILHVSPPYAYRYANPGESDDAFCDRLVIDGRSVGTHFIWHLLNAVVIFLLLMAYFQSARLALVARGAADLEALAAELGGLTEVLAVAADVSEDAILGLNTPGGDGI